MCVQEVLERVRTQVREGSREVPSVDAVVAEVQVRLDDVMRPRPKPVINATGVVLHTNLGRAPLAPSARSAMLGAAGYCDLEIAIGSGIRQSRLTAITWLLRALCHAEDVLIVNNGAAAILLACTALTGGRPGGVALSRGQMVEIGDSFRVADMAAAGGTPVVAVGSTNRTHTRDYQRVCESGEAAAMLWVHRSNFTQAGFVGEPGISELKKIADAFNVSLIADLGSGCLHRDLFHNEPTIAEVLAQGADIVTCSGDKLLGGPQAGLLAGRREVIAKCRRHPMARALRVDKVTLAALHATLVAHASEDGERALPIHALANILMRELRVRAEKLIHALEWPEEAIVEVPDTVGGGSLPGQTLPGVALCVPEALGKASAVARKLRSGDIPVFARVHAGRVFVHLRTVFAEDDPTLCRMLAAVHP